MKYNEAAAEVKALLEADLIVPKVDCTIEEKAKVNAFLADRPDFAAAPENPEGDGVPTDHSVSPPRTFSCTTNGSKLVGGTWDEDALRYEGSTFLFNGAMPDTVLLDAGDPDEPDEPRSPYLPIYSVDYPLPYDVQLPYVDLLAFDYTVNAGIGPTQNDQTRNPSIPQGRETDWIAVSRFGGEEINSMDGFTGISRQVIRVSPFSPDRERLSWMADHVVDKISNYIGLTPNGLDFQCCLLDEVFDNNDEESGIYGMDMFFVVVVSG